MAISQNSSILYTDLKSKYDSFNTFITNYGGSITKLTVPANSPAKVNASDINNLNGKINEFKADTYLKTKADWWVNKTVTAGNLAYASDWTNINTTISNFAKVKCRNQGTYSNGNHSHNCNTQGTHTHNCNTYGTYSHNCNTQGTYSHNCNTQGTHTHNCNTQGTHSHNCNTQGYHNQSCSDGTHSHNCNPYGTHGNNCSNGNCNNNSGANASGSAPDWTGCYASCTGLAGFTVSPSHANGCGHRPPIYYGDVHNCGHTASKCNSMYYRAISFTITGNLAGKNYIASGQQGAILNPCGTQKWQDWSGKFTGTVTHVSQSCNPFGTNNVACSNGNRNVACNNGTRSVSCSSNGARNVACNNVARNVACSHVARNVACNHVARNVACNHVARNVACSHVARNVSCSNVVRSHTTFIDITCVKKS